MADEAKCIQFKDSSLLRVDHHILWGVPMKLIVNRLSCAFYQFSLIPFLLYFQIYIMISYCLFKFISWTKHNYVICDGCDNTIETINGKMKPTLKYFRTHIDSKGESTKSLIPTESCLEINEMTGFLKHCMSICKCNCYISEIICICWLW